MPSVSENAGQSRWALGAKRKGSGGLRQKPCRVFYLGVPSLCQQHLYQPTYALTGPGESWATATETEQARQLQYDGKEDAVGLSNRG